MTFQFWDSPTSSAPSNRVGGGITVSNVTVTAGIASCAVPVIPELFDAPIRYLGISINGTELPTRVLITAVPYALRAKWLKADADSGEAAFFDARGRLGINNSAPADAMNLGPNGEAYQINALFFGVGGSSTNATHLSMGVRGLENGRCEIQAYKQIWVPGGQGDIDVNPEGGDVAVGNRTSRNSILQVYGTNRCDVLQILGGADLAEHLTIDSRESRGDEFRVQPGMLVSIDSSRNRKFKLSDEPYDKKRVGIISGGNGVQPGLVLRDKGNPFADGEQPVALTGQVWCHADASFGSIEPGDLLTTSSTPGHAMKANDFDKARFAVIGQALTGLKEGRGWVQVLVGKQ